MGLRKSQQGLSEMAAVKRHVLFGGLPPECAALRNHCRIRQLVRNGTNRNVEYRPVFMLSLHPALGHPGDAPFRPVAISVGLGIV